MKLKARRKEKRKERYRNMCAIYARKVCTVCIYVYLYSDQTPAIYGGEERESSYIPVIASGSGGTSVA